jgi:glc operon protein GlcG
MRTITALELADCRRIAAAAELRAAEHNARVSIAICDGGGHPLLLLRLDGASPSSASVAMAKARMAALNGKPTSDQEAAINGPRPALLQLSGVFKEAAVAMGGGLPLLHNGSCIGAIGISGMTPDLDAVIAEAGAASLAASLPQ